MQKDPAPPDLPGTIPRKAAIAQVDSFTSPAGFLDTPPPAAQSKRDPDSLWNFIAALIRCYR